MLQIFFISVTDLLLKAASEASAQIVKSELGYCELVAILIASYVLTKFWGKNFASWVLKTGKGLLFAEIISFVPTIIIIGSLFNDNNLNVHFYEIAFKISMQALLYIPVALLTLFFFNTIYPWYKEPAIALWGFIKRKFKKHSDDAV